MATLTIRNLDDDLKAKLRIRAAENGRSMEAEVREVLRRDLARPASKGLGTRIHEHFVGLDARIEQPPRNEMPRVPDLPE